MLMILSCMANQTKPCASRSAVTTWKESQRVSLRSNDKDKLKKNKKFLKTFSKQYQKNTESKVFLKNPHNNKKENDTIYVYAPVYFIFL